MYRKEKQWPFVYTILTVLLFSSFVFPANGNDPVNNINGKKNIDKLKSIAATAKKITRAKGFDTSLCFLIDFSVNSGRNRFFVFDLQKDSVVQEGRLPMEAVIPSCFPPWDTQDYRSNNFRSTCCSSLSM